MLVEAQGNPTHLLFLSPLSTNAAQSLSFITYSHSMPRSPFYYFFLSLCLSFCLFLSLSFCFPCLHLVSEVRTSFLSSPDSLSSCPFLHPSSYLLSKANTAHSCIFFSLISSLFHQSPSGPTAANSDLSVHASLYVLSSSPFWTQFPLSFSIHLSWRTNRHHYTVEKKRGRGSRTGFAL